MSKWEEQTKETHWWTEADPHRWPEQPKRRRVNTLPTRVRDLFKEGKGSGNGKGI